MPTYQTAQPISEDSSNELIKIKCLELALEIYKCDTRTISSPQKIADELYEWVVNSKVSFQDLIDKHAKELISKPTT